MNLYLSQNGQDIGPFSHEEIRHKIYSGEIQRTALARAEDRSDWLPLDTFLSPPFVAKAPVAAAAAFPPDILLRLRDPQEKTALLLLYIASVPVWLLILLIVVASYGTILVWIGLFWLIKAIGQMMFAAYLKTNAVRVSEQQLPEVHRVVREGCQKLLIKCPDVYVMQQNIWNAYAAKIFGRRMVVLLSGAVDSILLKGNEQQLAWLVGHELGHHWAGHLDFSQKLAKVGGLIVWLGLWHSRRAELTCDRVGLYCAGALKASQLALMNATVGAQLASRVDTNLAVEQWKQHQGEFFVRYRTLYSTHPHLLARLVYLNQAAAQFGMNG